MGLRGFRFEMVQKSRKSDVFKMPDPKLRSQIM